MLLSVISPEAGLKQQAIVAGGQKFLSSLHSVVFFADFFVVCGV